MENLQQETGDRGQGTGDRRQETGVRSQEHPTGERVKISVETRRSADLAVSEKSGDWGQERPTGKRVKI
jgi:hypothetical protein